MEPVFMVLAQSAATAACLAIDSDCAVQDVDYGTLSAALVRDGQVLKWTGPRPAATIQSSELEGIVVDNIDAEVTGTWVHAKSIGGFVDFGYLHDDGDKSSEKHVVFKPRLPAEGIYDVRVYAPPAANRSPRVPVLIEAADGKHEKVIDQRRSEGKGGYFSVGRYRFSKGDSATVTISNSGTHGIVIVDAVQFVPVNE